MTMLFRGVVFPDGRRGVEVERLQGYSETQPVYEYYDEDMNKLDTSGYDKDYWFRVKDLEFFEL